MPTDQRKYWTNNEVMQKKKETYNNQVVDAANVCCTEDTGSCKLS